MRTDKKRGVSKKSIIIIISSLIVILAIVGIFLALNKEEPIPITQPTEEEINDANFDPGLEKIRDQVKEAELVVSLNNEDISSCEAEELTDAQKASCKNEFYFFKSLKENKNYCNNIVAQPEKDICNMIMNADNQCNKITGPDGVYCNAAFGIEPQCEEGESGDGCRTIGTTVKAAKEKTPALCDSITIERRKAVCQWVSI